MRQIISIILLMSVLAMSAGYVFAPAPAQAAVGSVIAQAGGCVGSGALSLWLGSLIKSGLDALQIKIRRIASDFVRNMLGNLVEGLLSSSVPTSSKDQSLLSYLQNKDYRDAVVARCLARLQLDNISNNITNIIQTRGRDGGPTFVTNWRTFLTQSQYRGENVFRAMLSTANLCPYFANDLKKSYGLKPTDKISLPGVNTRTGSTQTFSTKINCTLPKDFTLEKYQKDFAGNGGWARYAQLAQPQNNPFGASLLAQDQISIQLQLEQESDIQQVQTNKGYTGISGKDKNSSCKIKGFGGQCIVYRDIKTTGEYLAQNVAATVGVQFAWLTTAQGLNTIIEDVTQMIINKLFDQSDTRGGDLITKNIDGSTGGGNLPPVIEPPYQPPTEDNSSIAPGPGQCSYNLLGILDNSLSTSEGYLKPANEMSLTAQVNMLKQVEGYFTQAYKQPSAEVTGHIIGGLAGIDQTKTSIYNGQPFDDSNGLLNGARSEFKAAYKACVGEDWPPTSPN